MKSIIRKTEINWKHFIYGVPFLIIGLILQFIVKSHISLPFLGVGVSYSVLEILMGENTK